MPGAGSGRPGSSGAAFFQQQLFLLLLPRVRPQTFLPALPLPLHFHGPAAIP